MTILKTVLLGVALLAVACGGKDKKKPTTVADTTGDTAGPTETVDTQPDETGEDEGPSAELQPIVYFEFDTSELDDAARAKLEENAEWLKGDPARVLTIEGHTDEVGTTDYNLALGERRARTAKDYLVRLGIDANRVSIITYGEERPASPEDALNRRSVFIATKNPNS